MNKRLAYSDILRLIWGYFRLIPVSDAVENGARRPVAASET